MPSLLNNKNCHNILFTYDQLLNYVYLDRSNLWQLLSYVEFAILDEDIFEILCNASTSLDDTYNSQTILNGIMKFVLQNLQHTILDMYSLIYGDSKNFSGYAFCFVHFLVFQLVYFVCDIVDGTAEYM